MLLGLAVRWLPFDWGQHVVNIGETVYTCGDLNSTPHILTVNVTAHLHYYKYVGKVNQSCPAVSAPLVSVATSSDLYFKYILQKQIFCVGTGENETWLSVLQRETVKTNITAQDVFCSSNVFFNFVWNNTYFSSLLLLWSHLLISLLYAEYLHQQSPLMELSYWFSSKLPAWSVCHWGSKRVVVQRERGQESNLTYIKDLLRNR